MQAGGPCDLPEYCDGLGLDCPPDTGETITACIDSDGCRTNGCTITNDNDCITPPPIPTASECGLVVLALLLLISAKIYFACRKTVTAA